MLDDGRYRRVVALARGPLKFDHPRLVRMTADFDSLDRDSNDELVAGRGFDAFCCLGTTIAQAGSREAFRAVDHDYVLAFARWVKQNGTRRLVVVSALGANSASSVFYNRVKGETEDDLRALKFGKNGLVVVRPSLLDGSRDQVRWKERLTLAIARPITALIPATMRPILIEDVAAAMLSAAHEPSPPEVIESAAMQGASARATKAPRTFSAD
jgi:uncharacterized protein YbjT (DUF2867 family)